MRLLLALALALAVAAATAQQIYKWRLPDGEIVYSDRSPAEGAEPIDLPPLQIYSAPPVPPIGTSDDDATQDAASAGYKKFEVSRPAKDEALRDNGGSVSIALALEPTLAPGHVVEILMDGKVLGSGRSTSVTVTNVDRGSHTVRATIKDATGAQVAATPAITFHLKRASR